MKFFPYENFYILSPLKPDEVVELLNKEALSPDIGTSYKIGGHNPLGSNTPFKGDITSNKFACKPTIIYRNAFLPQITGSIDARDGGSRVHVKMKISIFVMIPMVLIITAVAILSILFMPRLFSDKHSATDAIPILAFLVLYSMVLGAFKSESVTSKTYLVALLDGEIA